MSKIQKTKTELIQRFFPIYFYRRHMDLAARDILGLTLAPHHRLILRDWAKGKHYNMVLASRGTGKTILCAIYFVLMCILYAKNKLMVVGGQGFRGAKFLLLEMEKVVMGRLSGQDTVGYAKACLQDNRRAINRDPSFWSMSFTNGSVVYGVPLGNDGQTIRGLRSFAIAQDEAFLLSSHMVQSVLEPMLNVLFDPTKAKEDQPIKSQSLKFSTIDYSYRDFYKEYEHYKAILEQGDTILNDGDAIDPNDISLFEFNFEDSFYKEGDKVTTLWGMDFQRIQEKKLNKNTDLEVWHAENKNIPMDVSGGYFPIETIEDCTNIILDTKKDTFPEALDSCPGQCILGIDTAPAKANTAFVIIKIGQFNSSDRDVSKCQIANAGQPCPMLGKGKSCIYKGYNALIYAFEANKMDQKKRVQKIYELLGRYNIIAIAMDARGGGYELADLLRDAQYIDQNVGYDKKPIYDPKEYPNGEGHPILKLYKITQSDNMIFNAYLKGMLGNRQFLLPKPLRGRPENLRLLEIYGHVETLISQLARIKATPHGQGLKYEIEAVDPSTGRMSSGTKDLYSALLYATGRLRELLIDQEQTNRVREVLFAEPIVFDM